jgi:hypothetical protein
VPPTTDIRARNSRADQHFLWTTSLTAHLWRRSDWCA